MLSSICMRALLRASLSALAALFIAGIGGCVLLTVAVWNSPDGQAGMAAMLGGFYAACAAAIVTFVVSLVRSNKRNNTTKS
jgi:hypothetical protein